MPPLPQSTHPDSSRKSAHALIRAGIKILPDQFRTAINTVRDFHGKFGHYPNILFPRTFNEKALVRKIFDRRSQLSTWADKYAVRDYVRGKIGAAVLPTLYHVTVNPSDIPFDNLPAKYVVKATHGSGWVYFVKDGATINKQDLIDRCTYWLSVNYYDVSKEWVYKDITPRIIVEEFLDAGTGATPTDFKFFVFGGKAKVIQVDVDRHTNHKRNFYSKDWTRIGCRLVYENFDVDIPKPCKLETMIDYAETLSDSIDFVRVDLYEVGDKVYFGELTMVPESGLGEFVPSSWDEAFGEFWEMRRRL